MGVKMTDKLNIKKISLSLAIVSAILYVVCVLLVAVAPDFAISLFKSLFHGVDITYSIGSMTFASVLIGLIEVVVYSLVAGALFGWFYNKLK